MPLKDFHLAHREWKEHKYIARVKVGDKYRYFYTQEEYNAYLKSKNKKSNSVSAFLKKCFGKIDKIFKKSKKEASAIMDKGKKFIDRVFKDDETKDKKTSLFGDERQFKYIAKVKLSNGKYRYFYDKGEYERYLKRLEYQKDEPDFMKNTPKIPEEESFTADGDMAEINEEYDANDDQRSRNCVYCSTAYELRCRGYNVQAADMGNLFTYKGSDFAMSDFYENPKMITIDKNGDEKKRNILDSTKLHKKYEYTGDTLKKAILNHSGKNTRGELRVSWKNGGAHSIVYEVDDAGTITIRDCQGNYRCNISALAYSVNHITITRTDNLKLKKGILKTVEDN